MKNTILQSGGKQYLINDTTHLRIDYRKSLKAGDLIDIDCIMENGKLVKKTIQCKVLNPLYKENKIIIMKKKRRKGYQKKNGFRAKQIEILIGEINNGK